MPAFLWGKCSYVDTLMAVYNFIPAFRAPTFCDLPSGVSDKLGCAADEKRLRNTALDGAHHPISVLVSGNTTLRTVPTQAWLVHGTLGRGHRPQKMLDLQDRGNSPQSHGLDRVAASVVNST